MKDRIITVKGGDIAIASRHEQDYISLTDMVKRFGDEGILYNWLRNRNTIEFLGIWEQIYNPDFKPIEFDRFKSQAGLNSFALSPKKWIEATGAIGLYSKSGRGGGTYAHKDIAFEFGSWLSPEFKLYLIKEFQRLKDEEAQTKSLEWSFQRTLAKVNYKIHTDAIKDRLIPPRVTKSQATVIYATEADLLNVAPVRHHCRAVAASQSKSRGQHARRGNAGTIGRSVEPRKHQRRADPSRIETVRAPTAIE